MKLRKITLCVDPGSSDSKSMYELDFGEKNYLIKYILMGPECMGMPSTSMSYLPSSSGMGRAEDNAWIRLTQEGQIFAIGRLAREYRAFSRMKPLKSTMIVPKVLAILGAIAEKENLRKVVNLELDLAILLPYGEISSEAEVTENLKKALQSFYFRGANLSFKLGRLKIMPEASGIASLKNLNNQKIFRNTNQQFVMAGHRNTSSLLFEKGSFSRLKSLTAPWGFYDFIDKFREKLPGVEREDVLKTIKTQGRVFYHWTKRSYVLEDFKQLFDLTRLITSGRDKTLIEKAYYVSIEQYWVLFSSWLEEVILPDTSVLWCCGGASNFFFLRIKEKFQNLEVRKSTEEIDNFIKALNYDENNYPVELIEQNLIERMMDVWGLFFVFSAYYKRIEVSV